MGSVQFKEKCRDTDRGILLFADSLKLVLRTAQDATEDVSPAAVAAVTLVSIP